MKWVENNTSSPLGLYPPFKPDGVGNFPSTGSLVSYLQDIIA